MTPGVWLTSFQTSALPDMLRAHADQLRHIYLDSPTRVLFAPFSDSPAQWQQAHSGRAFGPTLEVRWRRADMLSIEAQLLWEADRAPPDVPAQRIKWTASDWNTRFEPAPRPRNVLLTDRPDLMLCCLDYLCEGVVALTRLCDIATL
ncbi:MAG: hypothetical protein ACYDBJ_08495 [Aggregatilineales bacterium]